MWEFGWSWWRKTYRIRCVVVVTKLVNKKLTDNRWRFAILEANLGDSREEALPYRNWELVRRLLRTDIFIPCAQSIQKGRKSRLAWGHIYAKIGLGWGPQGHNSTAGRVWRDGRDLRNPVCGSHTMAEILKVETEMVGKDQHWPMQRQLHNESGSNSLKLTPFSLMYSTQS